MKKAKLIAGIVWLIAAAALIAGLIGLFQRLLISGVGFIDELGGMIIEEHDGEVPPTAEPTIDPDTLFSADDFDGRPVETPEPEELIVIPVEQTAEELAKENQQKPE